MNRLFVLLTLVWAPFALADDPRLGLNFMRYHWERTGDTPLSVEQLNKRVSQLGVDAMRQLVRADLVWRDIEPSNDQWDFTRSDSVLNAAPAQPVVTLFSLQYASATPPWAQGPGAFRPVLGPAARDYVTTVVQRYADSVRYWEIGNEMDHWRAADPGDARRPPGRLPPHRPPGGFTPEQQGAFVAAVAALIREHDPDAVILMPGMAGLSPYVLETWLPGFVRGAGTEAVDVVGYHFYGPWSELSERREALGRALERVGLSGKPVWLTETGSTSDPGLTQRTNYPNSPESQAADVFRRVVTAWAAGDSAVFWHTLVSSRDRPRNRWRGYGLTGADAVPKPAYWALRLLATHLKDYTSVSQMSGLGRGQYGYVFVLPNGSHRWVVWGRGEIAEPSTPYAKGMTSVMPAAGGKHSWRAVPERITLSQTPQLLRD